MQDASIAVTKPHVSCLSPPHETPTLFRRNIGRSAQKKEVLRKAKPLFRVD